MSNGDIVPYKGEIQISFDKAFDDTVTFFTLDTSLLDGTDILAPTGDNPIQAWDFYEYKNYTERLMYQVVTSTLEFPYSVVSSIADFQLGNYDGYFTPRGTSPIAEVVLPKRPVRLFMGVGSTVLPQFVGLTQGMPEVDRTNGLATFTAMDFLTWIYDMPIRNTIAMQNVRTDEVLANIFEQFGLAPGQYDLAEGRNVIPFLFFEREQQTAGDIIRPLMEAEMGMLWLDEQGIIRFRPRLEQPDTSVYLFDEDNILNISNDSDDTIINHVIITATVREVQEFQIVHSKTIVDTILDVIPASSTYIFKASLENPCLTIEEPTPGENSSVSWFSAALPDGTPVNSGVTVTATELKTNSYDITFSNANSFPVNINQLNLWGQPAKNISETPAIYDYTDSDSIEKYEDIQYTIDNNFIQSSSQAKSLGFTILGDYSEYADIVSMDVKPNLALQLSDIVEIDYEDYSGLYRLISKSNKLQDNNCIQTLKLRKYTPYHWFTLDQSVLDGTDVLAP